MSGGAFDYACHKVGDVADAIDMPPQKPWEQQSRHALARLLFATVHPLKDLEWWKSGDSSAGEFIRACHNSLPEMEKALAGLRQALALVKPCEAPDCTEGLLPQPVNGTRCCPVCHGTGFVVADTGEAVE